MTDKAERLTMLGPRARLAGGTGVDEELIERLRRHGTSGAPAEVRGTGDRGTPPDSAEDHSETRIVIDPETQERLEATRPRVVRRPRFPAPDAPPIQPSGPDDLPEGPPAPLPKELQPKGVAPTRRPMTARLTPPSQSEMQQLARERFGATTPRRRVLTGIAPLRDRFYRYVIKRADPARWSKDIDEWLEDVERRTRIAIDRSGGLRAHRELEARRLLGGFALAMLEIVTGLLQALPNAVAGLFGSAAEMGLALERIRAARDGLAALQRELEALALSMGPLDMPLFSPFAPSINELAALLESLIGQLDTMLVALRERDAVDYMRAGSHLAITAGMAVVLGNDILAAEGSAALPLRRGATGARRARPRRPARDLETPYGRVRDRGFEGRRIREDPTIGMQRDLFEWNQSNVQNMLDGYAPVGRDGHPVELHHRGQAAAGWLDEYSYTQHHEQYGLLHGEDFSRIDRDVFSGERARYWIERARKHLRAVGSLTD